MKIWIANDYASGRYLDIPDERLSAVDIAYKYGRAESGEIIWIYYDGNIDKLADARAYWDSQYREYRHY